MGYIFVLFAGAILLIVVVAALSKSGKKSMKGTISKEDSGSGGLPK